MEKSIKACLLAKGWELEKIHNIERLLSIAGDFGISVNISGDDVVFIDSIYRGRYPADVGLLPLGEPSDTDANRALSIADNTYNSIQTTIQSTKGV